MDRTTIRSDCVLFDFESGNLDGWTLTGTAFTHQPTYGDNALIRNQRTSNLKGDWYIGTYEKRPSLSDPYAIQGNGPTGTATSPPFVIRGKKLSFLMAGGAGGSRGRFELLISGSVVRTETNTASANAMTQREFDVSSVRGQEAQVRIVDGSSGYWAVNYLPHVIVFSVIVPNYEEVHASFILDGGKGMINILGNE
ncbi:hypothetical protein AC249_AIPGENE29003 [Exaiptasia diaphana]|nr:hypothetical protein AC249_AIPGENE29003 [Exaiptasia diaphana]